MLCTNPAALGGGAGAPRHADRTEPFPGFVGAATLALYGGMPPSAPTPWVQPQDHYTGRCVREDGANVLRIERVGSARVLLPSPDPTWGLHLVDVNIALGDLVRTVKAQTAAYVRSLRPRARPCLRLGGAARGPRLGLALRLGTRRIRDRRRLPGRRRSAARGLDRYCVTRLGNVYIGYPTRRTRGPGPP